MIPGDLERIPSFHRRSNSGILLINKRQVSPCECAIVSRMFAGTIPPLSSHLSPEAMKQPWQADLNESTSFPSTVLQTATMPSSSSSEDRSAGKSAVDEGRERRSTANTAYGLISLMGRRRVMEDAVTAVPSLTETLGSASHPRGFFAVYGGYGVADKRKERLHHLVAEEIGDLALHEGEARVDWERVMKQSFARMDKELICGKDVEGSGSGEWRKAEGKMKQSTALVAVVGEEEVVVANCGNSMAVLCQGGTVIPLTPHHKGRDERERVESVGGSVVDLSTSPSIGVTVYRRTQSDEFLILASDGFWDVVSSDMACELVKKFLLHEQCRRMKVCTEEEEDKSHIEGCANHVATMLAELAISRGSKDNVSVAVVMLC